MKEKFRQLREVWTQLRQLDDKAVWLVSLGGLIGLLVGVGAGLLSPVLTEVFMVVFGLSFAVLGGLMVFARRAKKAQYTAIEGQPGAGAAVLQQMRGQWFVNPAVAVNSKQDMVHRVVGKCGIVLVGEGSPQRVKGLLAKERKRLGRVAGDVPVNTMIVGDREGEVPLTKLQIRLNKLPRKLRKGEVPKLERKLKPLDKNPPVPKGIDPFAVAGRRPKPR